MPQTADIDLVRQTLVNRLQSPYAHQRGEAKVAIAAFDRIVPFIMPTLDMAPTGYRFYALSFNEQLRCWQYVMITASQRPDLAEYGDSPRDAFDACIDKLKRMTR